jgi:O-6-methylguanine DNA methyltransferase
MTQTYKKIYDLVKQIPQGKVSTYGEISKHLGIKSPRVVGHALHVNPDPTSIPCHRVVNSKGMVAENFAFGGGLKQMDLLKKEGIVFKGRKIDLEKYREIF